MKVTLFRQKVTFLLHKSYTLPTEVVDGSNESLYYPNEELGPYLKMGVTFVLDFQKVVCIQICILSLNHFAHTTFFEIYYKSYPVFK